MAVPAALQALRFSMDIHGKDSVELVPSYLLLGEASIGNALMPSLTDKKIIRIKTTSSGRRLSFHGEMGRHEIQ